MGRHVEELERRNKTQSLKRSILWAKINLVVFTGFVFLQAYYYHITPSWERVLLILIMSFFGYREYKIYKQKRNELSRYLMNYKILRSG